MTLTADEVARYSRHLTLAQVGMEGQSALKASRVLCVGTGGLGSPAAMYLAAAGVGTLGLADFDTVDVSNLQRQILHRTSTVGVAKVTSAAQALADLNPHVQLELHEEGVTRDNALALVQAYDLVVDGTDNFNTRYLLNDACVLARKPYIYGAISRFEGQVSVFNYRGGPNYRDLYPDPPEPGSIPSCAEAGVLGVLPGVVGTLQATEALKVLLDMGEPLSGRILLYDALSLRFRELRLAPDPGRAPITALPEPTVVACADDPSVATLTPATLKSRWAEGWRPRLLDVRTAQEAAIVRLPLPHHLGTAATLSPPLTPGEPVVVFCKTGGRSHRAAVALAAQHDGPVYNLTGGLMAWIDVNDPHLPRY